MKKIISVIIISAFCVSVLPGCGILKNLHDRNKFHLKNIECENAVIDCLNGECEPARLAELFCERSKNLHDLDQEISAAAEFIDGEFIAEIDWSDSSGQESATGGKTDLYESLVHTRGAIKTDAGCGYVISFVMCHADLENDDLVGISYIKISLADDEGHPIDEFGEYFLIGG